MKKTCVFIIVSMMCFTVGGFCQSARFTNIRSAGFGGAGVAVVPTRNTTPLQVNPAAPALMADSVVATIGIAASILQPDVGEDRTAMALLGEYYACSNNMTLFGSGIFEYDDQDPMSGIAIEAGIGFAMALADDLFSAGARGDLWYTSVDYDDGYVSVSEDLGPGFTLGFGVLIKTDPGFNFGFSFQSEDDDSKTVEIDGYTEHISGGVPQIMRIGGAYQPARSPWLFGLEMTNYDMNNSDYNELHLFTEYLTRKDMAIRGGFSNISESGFDVNSLSGGLGMDMGNWLLDWYLSISDYDGAATEFEFGIGFVI